MKKGVKRIIIVLVVVVFLSIALLIYLNFYRSSKYFSYSSCNNSFSNTLFNFIQEAKWEENNLIIKSNVYLNCCVKRILGDYKVIGNDLILDIRGGYGFFACKCDCNYETMYNISNLEKKDYNIILIIDNNYNDTLSLKQDNSISDFCDQNMTYDCYKYKKLRHTESKKDSEIEFRFAKPEYKEISDKYPDFLYYYKKSENFYYYDLIEIDFKNDYISVAARDSGSSSATIGALGPGGDNFEMAVINYIREKRYQYLDNPLINQLNLKYGVNTTFVTPNEGGFEFVYNNESIFYFYDIEFINRPFHLQFEIDNSSKLQDLTKEQLFEYINVSDKVYHIIVANEKIDPETIEAIHINLIHKTATLTSYFEPDLDNQKYMVIHNRQIAITEAVRKSCNIDYEKNNMIC